MEEILVSSLADLETVSWEESVILNPMRWGVEEDQEPQTKDETRNFGSRKLGGIYQEFHANILFTNLLALKGLAAVKQIEKNTKNIKRE